MADISTLNATAASQDPVAGKLDARGPRPRRLLSWRNIALYGTLIVIALYFLIPLYVMLVTSLKDMTEIRIGNVFSPPVEITFQPWVKAWAEACTGVNCDGLSRGFWNSVSILVPSVILSITIAMISGYTLSKWRFRGSELFFTILIIGAFIPYQVMLYPIVIILRETGNFLTDFLPLTWIRQGTCAVLNTVNVTDCTGTEKVQLFGSLSGLVVVHTIFGMPILTLLFRNYFVGIPDELFKAARIDGAGFWSILFRIMLPMSLPILVVAMILQVTGIWNDFLFGVVFTRAEQYPMTVQLNNIVNSVQGVKEYNVNMAATVLTGLVPLTVYFISGKLFVRGIAAGAVKG